jgi:hypothetical protein
VSEPLPLAAFEIDDHTRVLIQTTPVIAPPAPSPAPTPGPAAGGDQPAGISEELHRRLRETVDVVRPAAGAVLDSLKDLNNPAQVQLELGIGISGGMDAFIASSSADVSFKVKLTWENPKPG